MLMTNHHHRHPLVGDLVFLLFLLLYSSVSSSTNPSAKQKAAQDARRSKAAALKAMHLQKAHLQDYRSRGVNNCSSALNVSEFREYLTVGTRGDGVGTGLLVIVSQLNFCHRLQMFPRYPHWEKRAGTKDCFSGGPCISIFNDGLRSLSSHIPVHHPPSSPALVRFCPPQPKSTHEFYLRATKQLDVDQISYFRHHFLRPLLQAMSSITNAGSAGTNETAGVVTTATTTTMTTTLVPAPAPASAPPLACVHWRLFDQAANTRPHGTQAAFKNQIDEYVNGHAWPIVKAKGEIGQSSFTAEELTAIASALQNRYPKHTRVLVGCDSGCGLKVRFFVLFFFYNS